MGSLCGKDERTHEEKEIAEQEKAANKALKNKLAKDQMEDTKWLKLLLLGAGDSGKSTLFKQMKTLQKPMPMEDRMQVKQVVHQNVIEAMQVLLAGVDIVRDKKGMTIEVKTMAQQARIMGLTNVDTITVELGQDWKAIWEDPGIQTAYENRACFQLIDSAEYFFNRIWDAQNPITAEDFIPSETDVLRSRVRTTGIVEQEFSYELNHFRVFDVGGQRNERKKWMHCFEGVTALLFVGVLSEYNLQLFEDEKTNRMVETLKLFRETVNNPIFSNTAIILFLNKRDLFEAKIETVPLTVCDQIWREAQVIQRVADSEDETEWVDITEEGFYTEPTPFDAGCDRIREQFFEQFDNEQYPICHLTSAIDKDNFRLVFDEVKEIIVKQSLGAAGLM